MADGNADSLLLTCTARPSTPRVQAFCFLFLLGKGPKALSLSGFLHLNLRLVLVMGKCLVKLDSLVFFTILRRKILRAILCDSLARGKASGSDMCCRPFASAGWRDASAGCTNCPLDAGVACEGDGAAVTAARAGDSSRFCTLVMAAGAFMRSPRKSPWKESRTEPEFGVVSKERLRRPGHSRLIGVNDNL